MGSGRAGQVPPGQGAKETCWSGQCLVPGSEGWLEFSQVDKVEGAGGAREAAFPKADGKICRMGRDVGSGGQKPS